MSDGSNIEARSDAGGAAAGGATALVSVGVPVYNGEEFLEDALSSIRGQTYQNLEIIIADNASDDRTEEICRRHAEVDPRITYIRHPSNLGASRNFNYVVEQSSGPYFKWAAHDDVLEPEFIEECVHVLDADPEAVLCHSEALAIDEEGSIVGPGEADPAVVLVGADAPEVRRRFASLILTPHYCYDVFGVIRADVLRGTSLIGTQIGSDRKLLTELGLRGRLARVDRPLFLSRDHSGRSVRSMPLRERAQWFSGSRSSRFIAPQWRELGGIIDALYRWPAPMLDKVRLLPEMVVWLWKNKVFLARDLRDVVADNTWRRVRLERTGST